MKDKDLIYIGIIAYLAYLLLNKHQKQEEVKVIDHKANPVGNATNGGLNLPSHMGLPNLTPTPPDGLHTEDALNESNIKPLIKDNEPTQLFGSYNLPTPYYSTSITIPAQTQEIISNQTLPIVNSNPIINAPISGTRPTTAIEIVETPTPISNTLPTQAVEIVETPRPILDAQPTAAIEIAEIPKPLGTSIIQEPILPVKGIKAEISTTLPIMNLPVTVEQIDDVISKCGKSFSLPNNDKEGSYTNYWVDGKDFYNQTTSPLIKTIPVKISYDAFIEGCKKYQMFQLKYTAKV